MSALQDARRKLSRNDYLDDLNDRQRRRILRELRDRTEPMSERELAERLVAVDRDVPVSEVPDGAVEGVQIRLQHAHLPRLAESDFVEWDRDEGTVAATDHPVYRDQEFQELLELDDEEWDRAVACTASGHRRDVLSVLESRDDSVRRDVLAHLVAARAADGEAWANDVEAVRNELHHVHLPKLDRAGVLEYDADSGTVTYRDGPDSGDWDR